MNKPTVPEVMPLVRALYERHSAGCCWHVVLDDGNVQDEHVQSTVDDITKWGCKEGPECLALCAVLPLMSKTQRAKLSAMVWER